MRRSGVLFSRFRGLLQNSGNRLLMRAAQLLAITAAALLPASAATEIVCALGANSSAYNASQDQRPSPDTMQIVHRVDEAYRPICQPRCPQAAMFRNATAANLMLLVSADGGKMAYSPEFFASAYGKYGETGIIALIAHVYGHAIDETTESHWIPSNWNPELRADAWAGCVMAMTAPTGINSALAALSAYPPSARAAWSQRLPAVKLGYTHCGGETAKFDAAARASSTK